MDENCCDFLKLQKQESDWVEREHLAVNGLTWEFVQKENSSTLTFDSLYSFEIKRISSFLCSDIYFQLCGQFDAELKLSLPFISALLGTLR